MAQHQVNIRVDDADYEVLEAGAFVEHRSLADEFRAALHAWVVALKTDPDVASVLSIREERDGKKVGNEPAVTSLDTKRKRPGRRNA